MQKLIFTLFFTLSFLYSFSQQGKISGEQNQVIDSLYTALKNAEQDTTKITILNKLAWELSSYNPDTAMILSTNALSLALKINWQFGIGQSYNQIASFYKNQGDYALALDHFYKTLNIWNKLLLIDKHQPTVVNKKSSTLTSIGTIYQSQGDYPKALENYLKALKIMEEVGNKDGIATISGNLGIVYQKQGDSPKALEYYFKALKMDEEGRNKKGLARDLLNIGSVFYGQNDYPKALHYYFKALKISKELDHKNYIAGCLGNIGIVYWSQGDFSKTLEYYIEALNIMELVRNKNGIATILGNIGNVYQSQGDYPKALEYYFKALKMDKEIGNKNGIARHLGNIGSVYNSKKNYEEAEKYLLKALLLSDSIGDLNLKKDHLQNISELYLAKGEYKKSLEHYKQYSIVKDSLFNTEKEQSITRKEMNFEFEKKEVAVQAEHEKQIAIAVADKKRQQMAIWSVGGGLLLALVFSGFILRSLRVTRKQKIEIEKQKHLVEEHQKEIIDSIIYAKRLQEAILPPKNLIKKCFPNSFVFYQPKDIVAGDFYWMEKLENAVFIAAADCTGHGVPGAMVSVVCSNALNRAVKEFGLRDTGKILDKVTELVVETFEKSGEDVKDGMDISLLRIDLTGFKNLSGLEKPLEIQWTGANNPLWYIPNGEIIKIKPDKQPIGKYENKVPFTTHTLTCKTGTIFYLFTDGLPDQFGGPKGKKYMYRQLEENLLAAYNLPMENQQELLQNSFNEWKGNLEQVDDVTIIGIKL